jgi:peptidoglycan/LPS O-acetylase OafA/YrhL
MLQTLQSPLSIPAQETTDKVKKLEALTSLRFFAAVMIFILHVAGVFDFLLTSQLNGLGLWQGVSFFFVLSGFILTYVHPELLDTAAVNKFMVARFARIWPTYFVAFCLYVVLLPECMKKPDAGLFALLHLLMIQSWTLVKPAIKAFNTPGWSISTEFFFYLYFPVLLHSFALKWRRKLLFTFSLVVLSITAAALAAWPSFAPTVNLEVNINPLCRLFEFSLGMATCVAYRRYSNKLQWTRLQASLLEAVSLVGIGGCLFLPRLMPIMENHYWLNPVRIWLDFCGAAPAYSLLIFLFACERGAFSQLMTRRLFVGLGEVSFSLYMFHLPILMYFQEHLDKQKEGSTLTAILAASLIALALSRVNFLLVEMPCRKAILDAVQNISSRRTARHRSSHSTSAPIEGTLSRHFALPLARAIEVSALVLSIGLICAFALWQERHFRFVSERTVAAHLILSEPQFRNVIFGDAFALRGLVKRETKDGVQLRMVWQSLHDQKLSYGNGIHLLNANGQVLSCQDYSQNDAQRSVRKGQFWQDDLFLSADQIKNATSIGLVVYAPHPLQILIVKGGPVDATGTKLLIPLNLSSKPRYSLN